MQEALGRGQDGAKGMGQRIRDVWRTNLHQEMALLRELVQKYPYISMVSMILFKSSTVLLFLETVPSPRGKRGSVANVGMLLLPEFSWFFLFSKMYICAGGCTTYIY